MGHEYDKTLTSVRDAVVVVVVIGYCKKSKLHKLFAVFQFTLTLIRDAVAVGVVQVDVCHIET